MYIPLTSRPYMLIPISSPPGIDPTGTVPEACLMPDDGTEPGDGDYITGAWIDGEVGLLIGDGGDVTYPAGAYFAWARISVGSEVVVLPSGRVRIGDVRS